MKHIFSVKLLATLATLVVAFLFFAVTAPADASPTLGCTFHTNAGEVGLPEQGCSGVIGSIDLGTCHIVTPVTETVTKGTFAGTTFTYDILCDDGSGVQYHYSTTGGVVPMVNDIWHNFEGYGFFSHPLGGLAITFFDQNATTGQDITHYPGSDVVFVYPGVIPGNAIRFGDYHLDFNDVAPLVLPNSSLDRDGSISFWVKPLGGSGASYIVRGAGLGEDEIRIAYQTDGLGNESWIWGLAQEAFYYPVTDNVWHHVAYVNDVEPGLTPGMQKLYIDGVLVDTQPEQTVSIGGITAWNFGPASGTSSFELDEFRTWIGALSDAQVADLATP